MWRNDVMNMLIGFIAIPEQLNVCYVFLCFQPHAWFDNSTIRGLTTQQVWTQSGLVVLNWDNRWPLHGKSNACCF